MAAGSRFARWLDTRLAYAEDRQVGRAEPIERIWELDLLVYEATGRRGVFVALEALATSAESGRVCELFARTTGLTVTAQQVQQLAAQSRKLTAEQVRRRLEKRRIEARYRRQFRSGPGGSSLRTMSGGLPGLGRGEHAHACAERAVRRGRGR